METKDLRTENAALRELLKAQWYMDNRHKDGFEEWALRKWSLPLRKVKWRGTPDEAIDAVVEGEHE